MLKADLLSPAGLVCFHIKLILSCIFLKDYEKLLSYSQSMFPCVFLCVGVSVDVGLVITQLSALPRIARYLSSIASHCSCHFSSFHVPMTSKLLSRDPEAALSEHAQCGALGGLTSECGKQCSAVGCVAVCTQQLFFYTDSTEQSTLRKQSIWGFTHQDYVNEGMIEWKLGMTFKAKQVNIIKNL